MQGTREEVGTAADPFSPVDDNAVTVRRRPDDCFLDYYFRRIDPRVAASFTAEQRQAIKTMFDGRKVRRHPVDIRRSIGFGRHRVYLVMLAGRERRLLPQSKRADAFAAVSSILGYLALTGGLLAVLAMLVYQIKG